MNNENRKNNRIKTKLSHLRLLLPCLLVAVMVFDGLMGYTMPDPFDGLEVGTTQTVYAAETPELEVLEQTGEKQTGKGPAGKLSKVQESGEYADGTYTGLARGFGGTIKVEVTVKDGKIDGIRILSASGETGSYLSKAKAVIGKIVGKNSTNVDAVSGATYSSNGIIKAVRNALNKATKNKKKTKDASDDRSYPSPASKRDPVRPGAVTGGVWKDGIYTGEGEGFGGKLHVQVTIENGKITAVELLDSLDGEEFISKAKSGIFTSVMQKQGTDVDAVTGATFSSYGLIEAINDALSKAVTDNKGSGEEQGDNTDQETGGRAGGSGTDSGSSSSDKIYKNGTYTRTAPCTSLGQFDYDINITLTVKDGRISSLSIYKGEDWTESEEDRAENDGYLDMAVNGYGSRKGMIDRILDSQSADVDSVTGATYSSNAIRSAVQSILSEIETDKNDEETDKSEADEASQINEQEVMPGQQPENTETPDGGNEQAAETTEASAGGNEQAAEITEAPAGGNEQVTETAEKSEEDSSSHTETKPEIPKPEPEKKEQKSEAAAPKETAAPADPPEQTAEDSRE